MKGQEMSDTIQNTEAVVSENTENGSENAVSENTVEVSATDSVETVEVPEKTAAEKASEAIAALDADSPLLPMINAFRTVLTDKANTINGLVREVREGGEGIESQIDTIIEDSDDVEIVSARETIEKMQAAIDEHTAKLRAKIAEENNLEPLTEEAVKEKTEAISDLRGKYNAAKTSSEKALKNMLSENADASVYFGDLVAPENISGSTGTGVAKPRLASAWVENKSGERKEIKGTGKYPSFGDVAEYISKSSGLTAVGNRIKPSAVSAEALKNGLKENGVADFEFTANEANVFKVHAVTR